jgi:hypothetical protein
VAATATLFASIFHAIVGGILLLIALPLWVLFVVFLARAARP